MREFRRKAHRDVGKILAALNTDLLLDARCYFGGGTLIALSLGEFRESRTIDFLCAERSGFRTLRESITQSSLGDILREPLPLAREVRADRDGIRTFITAGDDVRIKFEIVLEGRIDLSGGLDRSLGVPILDLASMVAEKFMANADRGLDESTHSRDLIDLAFIAARHGSAALMPGWSLAQGAYGSAIKQHLDLVLARFATNRRLAAECARALDIQDLKTMRKGLALMRSFSRARRGVGSRSKARGLHR